MNPVLLLGVNTDLGDCKQCGKQGVISKEYIVKVDFASLGVVNKVPISIVDAVEQEAS